MRIWACRCLNTRKHRLVSPAPPLARSRRRMASAALRFDPNVVAGEGVDGWINFGRGQPHPALIPMEQLNRSYVRWLRGEAVDVDGDGRAPAAAAAAGDGKDSERLRQLSWRMLNYGNESGDVEYKKILCDFLKKEYNTPDITPDELFTTGGGSAGFELVLSCFTKPGDAILVEETTYFLALKIIEDHRLRVIPVPLTAADGIDCDRLEAMLDAMAPDEKPRMLYTIPTYHNPSGATAPLATRRRLAALAAQHGFLIASDDVYQMLRFASSAPPPPPLHAVEHEWRRQQQPPPPPGDANVISIGTFSKIVAPGLRLGWIQSKSKHVIQTLSSRGFVRSGGCVNHFGTHFVRPALSDGTVSTHLHRLRDDYEQLCNALCDALDRHVASEGLSGTVSFTRPLGGYFVWLRVAHCDTQALLKQVKPEVSFLGGAKCATPADAARFGEYIRLSFAHVSQREMEEGVQRLVKGIKRVLE